MTHTYHIQGMTCNNCKATVEDSLNAIEAVTKVKVDLEQQKVVIEMSKHITLDELQAALPKKYTISSLQDSNVFHASNQHETTKLKQLQPLFLILTYITVASILLHYKSWQWQAFMLDFMGLFYIVFSFFKMLDLKGFASAFTMYDPLAKQIPFYAKVYPFIETILGLMFLLRFEVNIALVATIILLGITTVGVTKTLLNKSKIRCACLGTALNLPMTEATFIENAIMMLMALSMLFFM